MRFNPKQTSNIMEITLFLLGLAAYFIIGLATLLGIAEELDVLYNPLLATIYCFVWPIVLSCALFGAIVLAITKHTIRLFKYLNKRK